MRILSPAERRALRAKAHHLHPFVIVGQHGLTPAVLHEIDVNLLAHELIKIRVFSDDRSERAALLVRISDELDAAPVQHLGKILTLWRPSLEPVAREARAKASAGNGRPARSKPHGEGRRPRNEAAKPGSRKPKATAAGAETRRRKPGARSGTPSSARAPDPAARRRKPAPRSGKAATFTADPGAHRRKPASRSGTVATFAANPAARRRTKR